MIQASRRGAYLRGGSASPRYSDPMSEAESPKQPPQVEIAPWKELRRSVAYTNFGRSLLEVVYGWPFAAETTFSIKDEPSTVVVAALTSDSQIVLTRQFRPGPGKVLFDLPGGYIEDGEHALAAGRRELLEETGFEASLQYVGACHYDAYSSAMKHCVVGIGAKRRKSPSTDPEEQIDVLIVSVEHFRSILRRGLLTDVDMGYLALDFLGMIGSDS